MMSGTTYLWLAILICAAITFLLRFAPFALFGGRRGMHPALERVAKRMPAAIIAVLVVFCLKGLKGAALPEIGVTLAAVASVVALHLWRRDTLLSIAGGTVIYMLLLRLI